MSEEKWCAVQVVHHPLSYQRAWYAHVYVGGKCVATTEWCETESMARAEGEAILRDATRDQGKEGRLK